MSARTSFFALNPPTKKIYCEMEHDEDADQKKPIIVDNKPVTNDCLEISSKIA